MAKNLKDIDKAAESKGSFLVTAWQFVKFIVVSLLAMVVQIALTNLIPLIPAVQEMYAQPINILGILDYPVNTDAAGAIISGGLGYCIAFNVGNIVAQIVAFFVNKEKTFNSGANVAVALPIYIAFTIALILFSAWLNPTLKDVFLGFEWCNETAAKNIATMICSALQFFLYFPVDKILFHKKKEEK